MNSPSWEAIQAVSNIVLVLIALWAARVALKQLRILATTDLFNHFNDPDARAHRRWVYQHHELGKMGEAELAAWEKQAADSGDLELYLEHLESVCNSLDWAGLLVKKGLLRKKDAIDLYGDSVARCWVILRPWIEWTRGKRKSTDWLWKYFEELADAAREDDRFMSSGWVMEGVPIYDSTGKDDKPAELPWED